MNICRLIYTSNALSFANPKEIEDILQKARTENPKKGITGYLFFNNKYFLQCLEGPKDQVNALYNKIANDPRHSNVTILSYDETNKRHFEEWHMGYYLLTKEKINTVFRYSSTNEFNPFELNGRGALELLQDLAGLRRERQQKNAA